MLNHGSADGLRTLVLADLHLTRHTPKAVAEDLVRLVEAHRGTRIVFAGDLFDLSAESAHVSRDHGIEEGLRRYPAVARAFSEHVDKSGELWLVSGNHDREVGGGAADLASALQLTGDARARVKTTPWFFRLGALHVEHGHLYDPDNAPAHPLASAPTSLGVHFVEQFIAPTGAFAYLNVNDGTPLKLFLSSFSWYGRRAPYVIYRFFYSALTALFSSGPFFKDERARARLADERMKTFAADQGVALDVARGVLAGRARPTLDSMAHTFARLYLDRVFSTLGIGAGAAALALGRQVEGGAMLSMGVAMMAASWAIGHDRYAGTVAERLERGARSVADEAGARLVVFGHTHREATFERYANTGSFAFPRGAPGRPFLEIEGALDRPRALRRYWTSDAPR
ncbi:MAG: metallophosphoesterase [Myxococcales bacterium]|nr:metallophosphoesterase [Myxococcales bacterium]